MRPQARAGIVSHWGRLGIRYEFLTNPVRILGDGSGCVTGLECVRMQLDAPDRTGRPVPVAIPGSNFVISCDTVIEAVGEEIDTTVFPDDFPVKETGHLAVDPETRMCSVPRVFAAGDVVGDFGTDGAYAGGMKAARSIDAYLRGDRRWSPSAPSLDHDPAAFYGPPGHH